VPRQFLVACRSPPRNQCEEPSLHGSGQWALR
jgi:hypothetical protein